MNEISIFLAKYLIYLLAAWTVVSGWYLRSSSSESGRRSYIFWLAKLIFVVIIVTLIDQLINAAFPSDRPFVVESVDPLIPHGSDSSFPSTHAAQATVLASFIWSLRKEWGAAAFVLAALIGFGRVAARLHHPIDIVGGVLIGLAVSFLVIRFWPQKWA